MKKALCKRRRGILVLGVMLAVLLIVGAMLMSIAPISAKAEEYPVKQVLVKVGKLSKSVDVKYQSIGDALKEYEKNQPEEMQKLFGNPSPSFSYSGTEYSKMGYYFTYNCYNFEYNSPVNSDDFDGSYAYGPMYTISKLFDIPVDSFLYLTEPKPSIPGLVRAYNAFSFFEVVDFSKPIEFYIQDLKTVTLKNVNRGTSCVLPLFDDAVKNGLYTLKIAAQPGNMLPAVKEFYADIQIYGWTGIFYDMAPSSVDCTKCYIDDVEKLLVLQFKEIPGQTSYTINVRFEKATFTDFMEDTYNTWTEELKHFFTMEAFYNFLKGVLGFNISIKTFQIIVWVVIGIILLAVIAGIIKAIKS